MTYSEALPIMQEAFAMRKKEVLLKMANGEVDNEEFVNIAMAEDVITRAITRALKDDRDMTTEIDGVRYEKLRKFLKNMFE